MAFPRFALILIAVLVAAGATIWAGSRLAATGVIPDSALTVLLPVALAMFVFWRVLAAWISPDDSD